MKTVFLFFASLLFGGLCNAQNLVPNGSFEEYTDCPFVSDLLAGNVTGWYKCPGTPDYFNACGAGAPYGVPLNIFGYQWASHGSGYCGVVTYSVGVQHGREIIFAPLASPLAVGVPVYLSMKVARGASGDYPVPIGWTSKGIGLLLTTQPFGWELETPFPNTAHLYADEVLMDTTDWEILSTVFVPDSAYQYVTVGNFFNDSLSTPVAIDSNGFNWAYVFVDEVCVSLSPDGCDWGSGLQRRELGAGLSAGSPFSERLTVRLEPPASQPVQLALFDTEGRLLSLRICESGQNTVEWDTSELNNGLYLVTALGVNRALKLLKVLKLSP